MRRFFAGSRSAYLGVACTLAGAIGFSSKTVIVKLAYQYGVDTITLLALRMLFSLTFFVAMAWWAGAPPTPVSRRQWLSMFALGFIGYYLGSFLDLAGLQYISAGLGRLVIYLYPTIVLLLSAAVLRQPLRGRELASLGLSYGGIALVFQAEAVIGGSAGSVGLGVLLVFGSAVTYAVYLVGGSRVVQTIGSMRFAAYASIAASTFVAAHFLAARGVGALAVAPKLYWIVLAMAVFSTVLPLWLMAEALRRIGANQVALLSCVGPLSTIALARIALGEPVTGAQLAGAAFVLAGVILITLKPRAA
jgi:drug/metabolite transporter (DMT)-like permease